MSDAQTLRSIAEVLRQSNISDITDEEREDLNRIADNIELYQEKIREIKNLVLVLDP